LFGQGSEFQAEAIAALYVTDDGVGFDAALGNQKIEFGGHVFLDIEMGRLDEEAVSADVQNAGNVIAAVAAPADPDVLGGW